MAINRKDFIKKACLTGVSACGIAPALMGSPAVISGEQSSLKTGTLQQEWIAALLDNLDNKLSADDLRSLLKPCALTHYEDIGMDKIVSSYIGDIDSFISFLKTDWKWKAEYDRESGIIVCDENKDHCVCPMVDRTKKDTPDAICYCSEGFIEKMFSVVAGRPLRAKVDKSILRGDESCRYIVYL